MILIFGGRGQVGEELAAGAKRAGIAIMAPGRGEADIADAGQVARAIERARPTVVVNAAAYTNVDRAEVEADAAFRANATGPEVLAEQCAARGLPLVHFSTDYVFDGEKRGGYRESDPTAPLGVYGRSKVAGEDAIRARHADHLILRTSWVYGQRGSNFLKTMLRLAGERDELSVVADQHGCPTSTADIADAVVRLVPLLEKGEAPFGTYHFAGSGETTWHGFASAIVEEANAITGRAVTVKPIPGSEYPTPARRPANSVLDCGLFERTFGFRARPWQEAAKQAVSAVLAGGGKS